MKIVFSKFSNDRDPRFAIRTDILKDESGVKFVEKTNVYESGKKHIEELYLAEDRLEELYRGSSFSPDNTLFIDGRRYFEFIEGESMESELDALIDEGKIDEAEKKLVSYMEEILNIHERAPFTVTPAFKRVFGDIPEDVTLLNDSKCAPVTNIDMVPTNIINGKIIDYEWTFDFPIPARFVVYRIIFYYMESSKRRHVLRDHDLYGKMGISASELLLYQTMEDNFQKYVMGETIPVWVLKQKLLKNGYDINGYFDLMENVDNIIAEKDDALNSLKTTSEEATRMAAELDRIYRNPFYKMTKPFRMLKAFFRRGK